MDGAGRPLVEVVEVADELLVTVEEEVEDG